MLEEPSVTVEVVYVCVSHTKMAKDYAARFVASFKAFPPMYPCKVTIACNGGEPELETKLLFSMIECEVKPRENDPSWDMGAYFDAAKSTTADMLLCCGESVYWHRAGWLLPLVDAWEKNGPGMYGLLSSHFVRAHLNTTCFAIAPKLLLDYPKPMGRQERYAAEHGAYSLWRIVSARGMPVRFVTWDGVWKPTQWRDAQNILWRGDQSNLLAWCNHSDRFFAADARTKSVWSMHADRPFK